MHTPQEWRNCMDCQSLSVSFGCEGYSEYTPASPGEWLCTKGHFDDSSPKPLSSLCHTARKCSDYMEQE